jgi:protein ImuA
MRSQPMPRQAADIIALPLLKHVRKEKSPDERDIPDIKAAQALIARLRLLVEARDAPSRRYGTRQDPLRFHWTTGLAEIDRHLPALGLPRDGLHDVTPAAYGDFPAASGFALALMARRLADPSERRPILWCRLQSAVSEYGKLYGHGAESLGLTRQRLITITLKKPQSLLWTLEEALKSGAVAGVIGDCAARAADLTSTRRLQLAAQKGKAACLLVFTTHETTATASTSRWQVASTGSRAPQFDARAPGTPAWRLALTRVRSGRPGEWNVNWQREGDKANAPHRFNLVSGISGGAIHPWTEESTPGSPATGPALRTG